MVVAEAVAQRKTIGLSKQAVQRCFAGQEKRIVPECLEVCLEGVRWGRLR